MVEFNNQTNFDINFSILDGLGVKILKKYDKKNFDVSVAFIDPPIIKKLNKKYRSQDKITDVLSFSNIGQDNKFLGEIIICPEKIKAQAISLNKTFEEELIFIFVHGLLHLLGYNDEEESELEEMKTIGNHLIRSFL